MIRQKYERIRYAPLLKNIHPAARSQKYLSIRTPTGFFCSRTYFRSRRSQTVFFISPAYYIILHATKKVSSR